MHESERWMKKGRILISDMLVPRSATVKQIGINTKVPRGDHLSVHKFELSQINQLKLHIFFGPIDVLPPRFCIFDSMNNVDQIDLYLVHTQIKTEMQMSTDLVVDMI